MLPQFLRVCEHLLLLFIEIKAVCIDQHVRSKFQRAKVSTVAKLYLLS